MIYALRGHKWEKLRFVMQEENYHDHTVVSTRYILVIHPIMQHIKLHFCKRLGIRVE